MLRRMWQANRLLPGPLIGPDADTRMGRNIGTPSLVRMPDWAKGRRGRYHLYFSHHTGRYLRLAYADALTGPWKMHRPGVLDLAATGFPDTAGLIAAGVPDGPFRYGHIASPQVIADPGRAGFHMYFHGLAAHGAQVTRYAWSADGLSFQASTRDLGPEYARVTQTPQGLLAVVWGGALVRAPDWGAPFEPAGTLAGPGPTWRHTDIRWRDGGLDVLTTRIGDSPERILAARAIRQGRGWQVSQLTEVMRPTQVWEGAALPVRPSQIGMVHRRAHALRDPVFFTDDDGQEYMAYIGGGERGIGLATLTASTG